MAHADNNESRHIKPYQDAAIDDYQARLASIFPPQELAWYRTRWLFLIAFHLSVDIEQDIDPVKWTEHTSTFKSFTERDPALTDAEVAEIVDKCLILILGASAPEVVVNPPKGSQVLFTLK